jgi:DNA recombination protein RmuC
MKSLATDVGGLKKVLANVSTRGAMGELQAEQVLEDFLDHSQYSKNVQTNPNYNGTVEFAIRLPGNGEKSIWLPIDCKFPREDYEILIDAQNEGDKEKIVKSTNSLVANIKGKAKDIRSKYISPPETTDFAIMFLATEGLYAEVARQPGLIQELRQKHRISVCGPTNLMAFIDSMRMGFRTLALQEKAVEVWSVLGDVKNEMEKFGGIVQKAHKQALTVANTLGGEGDGMQRRLRALERALKDVETLDSPSISDAKSLED